MVRTSNKLWLPHLPVPGRRSFLKIGVAASASAMAGCWSRGSLTRSENPRTMLLKGERDWASSVCSLCASGCGLRVYQEGGRIVAVGGDPEDPNTGGKMCPIGLSMLNLHFNPDRLTRAYRKNPDGKMVQVEPEEILSRIAGRIRSGQALHIHGRITPFTAQLSKALNASCHLDAATDGISSYGSLLNTDGRPPVLSFENARIALLLDSNILEHGYPFVGYVRRIAEARTRGLQLVTLSPYLTNTATAGDWVPLRSPGALVPASLAIARQALNEPNLSVYLPSKEIRDLLGYLDPGLLEKASGISLEKIRELSKRFFSEPGPAISDSPDSSVLLLNLMKGNFNRPGGLLHPGQRILGLEADSADIARILRDTRNIVVLNQSNPAFSRASEILPILRSPDRATVVCVDSFMSETAELSDLILPLASPLETLTISEPLPLAGPYLAAALPVTKPPSSCRSFDDWLVRLAALVSGSIPPVTPESFAAENVRSASSTALVADRAIYGVAANPKSLEPDLPSIISSLKLQIGLLDKTAELQPEQCFLTVFEESVQGPGSAPSKWLDEITYSPKLYLNPKRAGRLGIRNGDSVMVTGSNGSSMNGIALLFEGVHPDAIAVPLHHGHTGYGRVARGERFDDPKDADMSRIFWGENRGFNPAEIDGAVVTIGKRRG